MPIPFKELAGSPVETFSPEGMKAQRRLLVAWENRLGMLAELLGDGQEFGGRSQAGYPDCPNVVVAQVRFEPWPPSPDDQGAFDDVAAQLNSYSGRFVQIVVDYELLDAAGSRADLPSVRSGTLLTYRMEFSGEYVALPGQALRWSSDSSLPVPPDAVPTVRVPVTKHVVTWHRVVNAPWAAIRRLTGTVNAAAFLGAAAETVLFDGATAERRFLGLDSLKRAAFGWRIAYTFREKTIRIDGNTFGWNHAYRPLPHAAPGWDKLRDEAGNNLYRTGDFSTLFQSAADV
jgi:hypothetical protein